jgi:hypothetical protein
VVSEFHVWQLGSHYEETLKMLGKLLLTVDATALLLGAPIADYNHTHIFNPRWTPHAKCVLLNSPRAPHYSVVCPLT